MTWKFQQIKPQKARGLLKPEMWSSLDWVAEEKYDGDRRIAQFCDERVRFTGCRESVDGTGFVEKTDNLPHLNQAQRSSAAQLDGTVLDGEIYYTDKHSRHVTSVMGSSPEEALRKQRERGWLKYIIFDCLFYKGQDLRREPHRVRRNFAQQALGAWHNPHIQLAEQMIGGAKRMFYDAIVRNGREGVVLKHIEHRYGDERLWVKVKAEWTADVVITGFEPGKGKYAGGVGAIEFGQWRAGKLWACGTCSGFSDTLREQMTQHPKKYIGKVIEIAHNGREPATQAFRHPRFKRFRVDKSSKDCILIGGET